MNKLLYITNRVCSSAVGGREQLSKLLVCALAELYSSSLEVIELTKPEDHGDTSVLERLNGYIDGVTNRNISSILNKIDLLEIDQIFLNGSNLGKVAERIRSTYPAVEITTFFHNCEGRFFLGALRQNPSLRSLGVLLANYRAERCAVQSSDRLICLNDRDSQQLARTYGRSSTHILPMAMHDRLPKELPDDPDEPSERYALFVGGTFYANQQGVEWFVQHVAASAPIKTYVVGKGFEKWKLEIERNGNMEVVGSVDSLVPWYLGAHFVIAPIFDGSGMKTKVAEALMFGKRVIGTPEAFTGYEAIVDHVGVSCQTSEEFLNALENEAARPFLGIDLELRAIYEEHYSFTAARDRLARILVT